MRDQVSNLLAFVTLALFLGAVMYGCIAIGSY